MKWLSKRNIQQSSHIAHTLRFSTALWVYSSYQTFAAVWVSSIQIKLIFNYTRIELQRLSWIHINYYFTHNIYGFFDLAPLTSFHYFRLYFPWINIMLKWICFEQILELYARNVTRMVGSWGFIAFAFRGFYFFVLFIYIFSTSMSRISHKKL